MPSCLGIYVDKNLIKYAKLRKVNDTFEVESLNMEVFENLEDSIKNIVEKTDSYKCPICTNISNELYNYFDVFSGLDKKDIKKSLSLEFEMLCAEKSYDLDSLESRYILMENSEDKEKYKALYISVNNNELEKKEDLFADYKLFSMTPLSTSITNLIEYDETQNVAIINLENETQITIVVDGQIKQVNILNKNLEEVIESVKKELSYEEAYNLFKTVTIYDKNDIQILNETGNKYLDLIMPVIYKTAKETKKIIEHSNDKISKVYITGMGATIDNIDFYFQEFFKDVKCEILKPFFLDMKETKEPIKTYLQMNSPIALALDGLGYLNKYLNFAKIPKQESDKSNEEFDLKNIFKTPFSIKEKLVLRVMCVIIMAIIIFSVFGIYLVKNLNIQKNEINESIVEATTQIAKIESDLSQIESHTDAFTALINASEITTQTTLTNKTNRIISKGAIPNLLNKISQIIQVKVNILTIKNTESKHIVIEAISDKYEQLIYFSNYIKEDEILTNVHSSDGEPVGQNFKITIEGDLP